MGRFQRSMRLFSASLTVLKQEKSMLWIPVLSFLSALALIGALLYPSYLYIKALSGSFAQKAQTTSGQVDLTNEQYITLFALIFAFYFALFFVVFFFNSVIIACSHHLLNGEKADIKDGFKLAFKRIFLILQWAFVCASIGVILKMIEERLGFIGQLIIRLLGLGWAVVSFMTLPVMIVEGIGPKDALKKSVKILKKTWGESLLGFGGMSLIFSLFSIPLIFVAFYGISLIGSPESASMGGFIILLAVIGMALIVALQSTLSTIYKTALYEYANKGQTVGGFNKEVIEGAIDYRKKRFFSRGKTQEEEEAKPMRDEFIIDHKNKRDD